MVLSALDGCNNVFKIHSNKKPIKLIIKKNEHSPLETCIAEKKYAQPGEYEILAWTVNLLRGGDVPTQTSCFITQITLVIQCFRCMEL